MQYPNAYRGVRRILIALLISLGLSLVTELRYAGIAALGWSSLFRDNLLYQSLNWGVVLGALAVLVLMIVGAMQARRDEAAFLTAGVLLICVLGIRLAESCLRLLPSGLLAYPADTWAYELCSIAYVLLLLWARLSLVDAGRALAEKCEAPGLRRFGKLLLWIIPLASLLPLILRVVEVIQLAAPALLQPIYEKYSYEKVLTWRIVQESCVAALELAARILLVIFLARLLGRIKRQPAPEPTAGEAAL